MSRAPRWSWRDGRPVGEADLPAPFDAAGGWVVDSLELERLHTRFHDDGVPAWLATIKRVTA
jgi:hypothetical protein